MQNQTQQLLNEIFISPSQEIIENRFAQENQAAGCSQPGGCKGQCKAQIEMAENN